jgi:hypothetical protein
MADYTSAFTNAGFQDLQTREYLGDAALVKQLPIARKFLDFPLLLVLEAHVP